MKASILVIEDEAPMRKLIRLSLAAQDFSVIESETGQDGIIQARTRTPDIVLVDLGLPDVDGLTVVKDLRTWSKVPIIVISARNQEESKVKALDSGADDYVTKPFGAAELLARIRVALRHAAQTKEPASEEVKIGEDVRIDLVKRVVEVRGEEVHLTPIEYKLLVVLVKHAGMVVTHRHLLEQVWGPGHSEEMQYLRVYVTQLRRKIEKNAARPRHLVTETGVGYRLKL